MQKSSLNIDKATLNLKGIHIQCLDENKEIIDKAYGSWFIVHENWGYYLYTCRHLVTWIKWIDMNEIEYNTNTLKKRKFLKIYLQDCKSKGWWDVICIGGNQHETLPLYDTNNKALWEQNDTGNPEFYLNSADIKVPLWHDVIRIKLPASIQITKPQYIDKENQIFYSIPLIWDKMYTVGYPYWYSTLDIETQPTPVTLVSFVAWNVIKNRHSQVLWDRWLSCGMSGSPVFIEHDNKLLLVGVYTGIIYPDHKTDKELSTALSTISILRIRWETTNYS